MTPTPTTTAAITATSLASASHRYALFGTLRPHYGSALFGVGFAGTITGQLLVQALLRRWRKESLIVLIIAVVIGGSALLMGGIGAINFAHAVAAGEDQGLRHLCEPEAPD